MSNGVHISRLAAHQITGSISIIKSKIFLQQFTVYRVTHAIKHALRTSFKHHLRRISKDRADGRHGKHNAD